MYCPNCAAPIDGAKFCRSCGANVSLVPQALTGQLPKSDDAESDRHWGRHHRERHRRKREPSVDGAITSVFTGIGFVVAAIAVAFFSPPGRYWGWVFLIPAFALIGGGIGQYCKLQEQRRQQMLLNQRGNRPVVDQPPMQSPTLSAPTTSELVKPSSVTEHTTRHLESSRPRE